MLVSRAIKCLECGRRFQDQPAMNEHQLQHQALQEATLFVEGFQLDPDEEDDENDPLDVI